MTGVKLLLLQFIDAQGQLLPKYEVAGDIVGAGLNEWVLVSRGGAARIEDGQNNRPLDAMVVGIIDTITVENRTLYSKRRISSIRLNIDRTQTQLINNQPAKFSMEED
jgi:carbon dioxide concentrating mechanism protein CcmL